MGCALNIGRMLSVPLLPGQYYDPESGFNDNGFRTYDPSIGGYLQPDPIGVLRNYSDPQLQVAALQGLALEPEMEAESLLNNPYAYADGNPVLYTDQFGLAGSNNGTGGSSGKGTSNPYKHCRPLAGRPGWIECRQKGTGKWIPKPQPPDWDEPKQKFECGDECMSGIGLAAGAGLCIICVLQPELCIPTIIIIGASQ